jgi:hypothetical protein
MLGRRDISALDRLAFDGLWLADHRYGEKLAARPSLRRAVDAARCRVRRRVGRRLEARGRGRILPVDERLDLSPEKFTKYYLLPARPVVLRGAAADWECCRRQQMPKSLGTLERDYLQSLAGPSVAIAPKVVRGKGGSTTRLHSVMTNQLYVQVEGEQRWVVVPPSYDPVMNPAPTATPGISISDLDPFAPDPSEFGMFWYVDRYEVTLDPGDVLFNPPFHWHSVTNARESAGIGLDWYSRRNARAASRTQHRLASLARH